MAASINYRTIAGEEIINNNSPVSKYTEWRCHAIRQSSILVDRFMVSGRKVGRQRIGKAAEVNDFT